MLIGESAVGDDLNAAHINVVLGERSGPVGIAWATALATPTLGHVPFMTVLQPSTAVKPFTLFVLKSTPESDAHRTLIWGASQAGVAAGVADAVADGVVDADQCDTHVIIASVWVNPGAHDADAVYRNNRAAARTALANAVDHLPHLGDVMTARAKVHNGMYTAPPEGR